MPHTGDHHLLERMDRNEFLRTIERARIARADAEKLLSWAARLLPLLDAHPTWTLAEAIDHYHADAARAAHAPEPSTTRSLGGDRQPV